MGGCGIKEGGHEQPSCTERKQVEAAGADEEVRGATEPVMRHHKQFCLRKKDLPDLGEDSEEAQMVLGADHGVEDKQDLGQRISLQEEETSGG